MALAEDISAEQFPGSQHGSMLSLAQSELQQEGTTDATELQTDITNLEHLSEIEMAEKLENILLHRIKDGDKAASFQLGQLYFEQVMFGSYSFSCHQELKGKYYSNILKKIRSNSENRNGKVKEKQDRNSLQINMSICTKR